MRNIWTIALCATLASGLARPATADQTVSPGKAAAYSAASGLMVTASYAQLAQVDIVKGKRKHVIEVDFQLTDLSTLPGALGIYVTVNGVQIEPTLTNVQVIGTCNHVDPCTLTGHYWADIDTLEAMVPDTFVGEPLVIAGFGVVGGSASTNATASLRARQIKK